MILPTPLRTLLQGTPTQPRQTALDQALLAAQELERARISSEIHDNFAFMVAAARMNLLAVLNSENLSPVGASILKESEKMLQEALEFARGLSKELSSAEIATAGLGGALHNLSKRASNPRLTVQYQEHGSAEKLNTDFALNIYRVIQEILNNYIKHSGGSFIAVHLYWSNRLIMISIVDNGKAFQYRPSQQEHTGLGMVNIWNRLSILNGQLESEAGPPNTAVLRVPVVGLTKE